jgi:Zn-dependent protease
MKFSLFGIPVHVQPMFWLVAVLLGAPRSATTREIAELAIWIGVLFVSILAHELGHAFAMRAYGRQARIELWGMGGLTHWGEGPAVTPGKDIVVSLAGPFAGLLLGGAVLLLKPSLSLPTGSLGAEAVRQALYINIFWGIVNLVPILPLDGGHVLESTAAWLGGAKGRRVAYAVSLVLAVGVIGGAIYYKQAWIGFLGFWCASISWRKWSSSGETGNEPKIADWVESGVRESWELLAGGRSTEAVEHLRGLLAKVPEGAEHDLSRSAVFEVLAWAYIEAGDDNGALDVRRRMTAPPSELLQARLLVCEGRVTEGIAQLQAAFDEGRNSFAALVLSSVYVDRDHADLVLAMLRSERGARLSEGSHVTLGAQLFYAEQFELALEASQLGFERFGRGVFAYNAACSLSRLGRVDEGIDWLQRAQSSGFDAGEQLDSDADISALRADPRFAEIRARMAPAPQPPPEERA